MSLLPYSIPNGQEKEQYYNSDPIHNVEISFLPANISKNHAGSKFPSVYLPLPSGVPTLFTSRVWIMDAAARP